MAGHPWQGGHVCLHLLSVPLPCYRPCHLILAILLTFAKVVSLLQGLLWHSVSYNVVLSSELMWIGPCDKRRGSHNSCLPCQMEYPGLTGFHWLVAGIRGHNLDWQVSGFWATPHSKKLGPKGWAWAGMSGDVRLRRMHVSSDLHPPNTIRAQKCASKRRDGLGFTGLWMDGLCFFYVMFYVGGVKRDQSMFQNNPLSIPRILRSHSMKGTFLTHF